MLNNDLAPTFAAIAGVEPPSFVDGRSFLPLLTKPATPWRRSFLLERRQMETHELTGNAILDAIRTARHTYIEYGTGERELYDLAADPFQLANLARTADPACCWTPWPSGWRSSRTAPRRTAVRSRICLWNRPRLPVVEFEPPAKG